MTQYTDLVAKINGWTNRPWLANEIDIGIRQAIRTAHKAGNFYRDLVTVNITGVTIEAIQSVPFTAAPFVRFKQLATIGPTGVDKQYGVKDILDLFDPDGYAYVDIVYAVGDTINIRAASPVADLTARYYQRPNVAVLADINDWLVDEHEDLIVLWAAASVLASAGEQEIKTRVEALAKVEYTTLIADALRLDGR